jgi:hypothetical protein
VTPTRRRECRMYDRICPYLVDPAHLQQSSLSVCGAAENVLFFMSSPA